MESPISLPPGQHERADFPRFGMTKFADRHPREIVERRLALGGDALATPVVVEDCLAGLPSRTITADFHCVTTWSHRGVLWGGVAFADFFEARVAPRLRPGTTATIALLKGQDGWRTALPLEDLLAADVLLATEMDGRPIPIAHGAPLRLVAPAHYGYKSVKHLQAIDFLLREPAIPSVVGRFLDHPRARVAREERVRWLPGRLVRGLGRIVIDRTVARFEAAETPAAVNAPETDPSRARTRDGSRPGP